ncbi:MAG: hypothetical protein LBT80_07725 [Lactobacillaceae bacterium]|nr:hypothetical protein [Lactobacillaceae bacterium]
MSIIGLGVIGAIPVTAHASSESNANVWTGDPSEVGGGHWGNSPDIDSDDEGQTEVSYAIQSSYTIVIPATMSIMAGDTYADDNVHLNGNAHLPSGQNEIYAQPYPTSELLGTGYADAWTLDNDEGTDSVKYNFGVPGSDAGNATYFSNDDTHKLTFIADGSSSAIQTQDVRASINDIDEFKYSGNYSDIVIWAITTNNQPAPPSPPAPTPA